jgi:hypothetical protein
VVIAKHGKEETEVAAPAPTEVPASKVTKKDQK